MPTSASCHVTAYGVVRARPESDGAKARRDGRCGATIPFIDTIGFSKSEVIGYSTMVLAFLMIYFGIRSYRDNVGGGSVSFGRAFQVGILITLIAAVCYAATWQLIYYRIVPDFMDKYSAYEIEKERAAGATEQVIEQKRQDMARYVEMYRNPFVNLAITFAEPLPVGLVMTLVSSALPEHPPAPGRSGGARIRLNAPPFAGRRNFAP